MKRKTIFDPHEIAAELPESYTRSAWRRLVELAFLGADIHITSDRRRAVILKIDGELGRSRLEQATERKEVNRRDAA